MKVRQGDVVVRNRLGVISHAKTPEKYAPKLGKYKSEVRLALDEARAAKPKPEARKNTVDRRDYINPE